MTTWPEVGASRAAETSRGPATGYGSAAQTFPDGGATPFKGGKLSTWEGGMRAPMVIRWPGVIRPGTVKNELFASLDWLPTFVNIAGGPKGDGLKKQTGIVKTTLDGVDQLDYLEDKSKSQRATRSFTTPARTLRRSDTASRRKVHRGLRQDEKSQLAWLQSWRFSASFHPHCLTLSMSPTLE